MKKNLCLIVVLLACAFVTASSACAFVTASSAAAVDFSVVWNKTYGGPDANDSAYVLLQQPDGRGYLFAGDTSSFGAGKGDAWVVNLTETGDEVWNRTFGGPENDTARALINTTDGNYLFAGSLTYVTNATRKDTDAWVVKLDPAGGIIWNRTFGGPEVNASAYAAAETRDGGYVVVGTVAPWGSPATDILVIKLNATGIEEWRRTFGEPELSDAAYSVVETTDGNIAVAGSTESFGAFATDVWVAKLDPAGDEIWNRTFGGPENDTARALVATPDGGLVFAGSYMSRDAANRTEDDALVVRMGPDGGVVWNWTYGDAETNESAASIIATADGGYLFVGESGKDPAGGDAWVVKLDSAGRVEGSRTLGGANPGDRAASAVQVSSTEYLFAGTFNATPEDGPVETDAWVVKLAVKPQAVPKPPQKPPKPPKICPPCPKPTTKPRPTPTTVAPAAIGDFVWNDTNADGIQDPGEPGIEGVTVILRDADLHEIATTKTDADGGYLFTNLTPGDYIVEFVPPEGMVFARKDAGDDDTRDSDANQTTGRTEKITLKAGEIQDWWDAGLVVPQPEVTGQIGGIVWIDANKDGIRDEDEAGLPDASVTLYYTNDTPVNTTKTNTAGRYFFTGLPQGDYYLAFDLPQGYTFTAAGQGDDDTRDSDVDPVTGRTEPIGLAGENLTRDAGVVVVEAPPGEGEGEPGVVTGTVWVDTDANGAWDEGDPGIPGIRVELMRADGTLAGTTFTGDDGSYTFILNEPGRYYLKFAPPRRYAPYVFTPSGSGSDVDPGTGTTDTFDVAPAATVTRNAGLVRGTQLLSGTVWYDLNANGIRDPGEPGIPGINIRLISGKGMLIGYTVTGPDGSYQFPPEIFSSPYWGYAGIEILIPEGYSCTVPGPDNDAIQTSETMASAKLDDEGFVDVGAGGDILNVGLTGEYQTGTPAAAYGWIRGTTWSDDNQNGVRDEPAAGITGVEVRLLDADGIVVASARTGYHDYYTSMYLFGPLLPGEYSLMFTPPEDYIFTEPGKDSHADPLTGMTDPFTVGGGEVVIRDAGLILAPRLTPEPTPTPTPPQNAEPEQTTNTTPASEPTPTPPQNAEPEQTTNTTPAPEPTPTPPQNAEPEQTTNTTPAPELTSPEPSISPEPTYTPPPPES